MTWAGRRHGGTAASVAPLEHPLRRRPRTLLPAGEPAAVSARSKRSSGSMPCAGVCVLVAGRHASHLLTLARRHGENSVGGCSRVVRPDRIRAPEQRSTRTVADCQVPRTWNIRASLRDLTRPARQRADGHGRHREPPREHPDGVMQESIRVQPAFIPAPHLIGPATVPVGSQGIVRGEAIAPFVQQNIGTAACRRPCSGCDPARPARRTFAAPAPGRRRTRSGPSPARWYPTATAAPRRDTHNRGG
jgi:hypothetical protein